MVEYKKSIAEPTDCNFYKHSLIDTWHSDMDEFTFDPYECGLFCSQCGWTIHQGDTYSYSLSNESRVYCDDCMSIESKKEG